MSSPMLSNSLSPNPRVVPAALDKRKPEVTVGFSGSKGTAFLLHVSPAASSRSLATFPVRPRERKSISSSAVSVPPDTTV